MRCCLKIDIVKFYRMYYNKSKARRICTPT